MKILNVVTMLCAGAMGLIALVPSFPVLAQTQITTLQNNTPADKYLMTPGGVDLRTGRYIYREQDVGIGGDALNGGIPLIRTEANKVADHKSPFENFSHNWEIMIVEQRPELANNLDFGNDFRLVVHVDGRAFTFEGSASTTTVGYKTGGPIARLTMSGASSKASDAAIYTYQAPDGTIIKFRAIGSADCGTGTWGSYPRRCAYASEMTQPNGATFTFDYDYNSGVTGNRARLRKVTSSGGYALILEGGGTRVTKACVYNLARDVPPAGYTCGSGMPTVTYAYDVSGRLSSVTRPDTSVWQFTYGANQISYWKPGLSAPWLTNTTSTITDEEGSTQDIVEGQTFSDGRTYSYTFYTSPYNDTRPQSIAGGWVTDNLGRMIEARYDFPIVPGMGPTTPCTHWPCSVRSPDETFYVPHQQTEGPIEVVDPLGRTTLFDYCDPAVMAGAPPGQMERCAVRPLVSVTDPEGGKSAFEYDGYRNINKITRYPKPGSSLPVTVETAVYDTVNIKSQTKPISMTDMRGAVTNYTYDPAHGGMLTAMQPAPVAGGARPLVVKTYAQKYAYVLSGTSLVPAATAIWMPATETECQTAAGSSTPVCDSGAAQKVTTFEYGANGTADNLLLRGIAVTAGGVTLRTCYGYDPQGRKISETKPAANLSVCP